MDIGARVAQLRRAHGDSLRQAADRTGVSHTTIARIEQGTVTGSMHTTLTKIAEGYGVTLDFILDRVQSRGDFDAIMRGQAFSARLESVSVDLLNELVRLLRKAVERGIDPKMLDAAIDLLALNHRTLASVTKVS